MKITSFYYLNYPDELPSDPENAASEIYVEVGGDNASINKFDHTYSFQVYTLGYIKNQLHNEGKDFLCDRSVIIVNKFDDKTIGSALESVLHDIDKYGIRKD